MKIDATNYTTEEILKIIREWTGLTQKEFDSSINRSERSMNLEPDTALWILY